MQNDHTISGYFPAIERLFNRNPEFKRNAWIELSPGRLIAMPAVIVAIVFMVLINTSENPREAPIVATSMGIFYVLVYLWGTKLAIDSIVDEVNGRTWIQQQMTPLSPWKMTIGKLFGSTIYAWYGGLIALAIAFIVNVANGEVWNAIISASTAILTGVIAHAVALSVTLIGLRKAKAGAKVKANSVYIIVLLFIVYVMRLSTGLYGPYPRTQWYWMDLAHGFETLVPSLFFAYWAVVGLYRNMRTELQFENDMGAWLWFLVTAVFYVMGYSARYYDETQTDIATPVLMAYTAFGVCASLSLFLAFLEPKDTVTFRRLRESYLRNDRKKLESYLPLWLPSLAFAIVLGIVATVLHGLVGATNVWDMHSTSPFFAPSILAFLIRDIAFIMVMNATGKRKSPDTAAMIYLLLLHVLLPMIIGVGSTSLPMALFTPVPAPDLAVASFLSGTVQAAITCYVLVNAWKQQQQTLESRFLATANS